MKKIFIADNHPVISRALVAILAKVGYKDVLVEHDLKMVMRKVKEYSPDLIIMDIDFDGTNSLSVVEQLIATNRGIPIVMYTYMESPSVYGRFLDAGVVEVLSKSSDIQQIQTTLMNALDGTKRMEIIQNRAQELSSIDSSALARFSDRERQVFKGVVEGKSNKAIAHEMDISPKSVSTYKSRITEKLGIASVKELTKMAGLIHKNGIQTP
ncbi:MAG: response regulator transcription factor [Bacteroidetes bacterium]|nr:MAG: response regulator transcription factor [Bacteroidota bacterium]